MNIVFLSIAFIFTAFCYGYIKWQVYQRALKAENAWSLNGLMFLFFPVSTYRHSNEDEGNIKQMKFEEFADVCCGGILKILPFSVFKHTQFYMFMLTNLFTFPLGVVWLLNIIMAIVIICIFKIVGAILYAILSAF